tara:strand:+ start:719 stop:1936 length:1218 start_codon:yes stop_codon:yes gene_type:complete
MRYKIIKKCQLCNSNLNNFLDLGNQPLCDDLKIKPNNNKFYKLKIIFCKNCLTAFQKYNINKRVLFPTNYHYRSANTNDVIEGMKDLVLKVSKIKNLKNKKVLDIGCNDGSLLDIFRKRGCKTFGVEPTGAYKQAKKKGHYIFNKYIDLKSSEIIKKKIGEIDVITFTNVFAHIENFKELINSLKKLISQNTLIVIENHYLCEVIKKNQFDTFYHEHPRTYSLNSFYCISKLLNFNIRSYNFVKRYNGNLRIFLEKKENKKINEKLSRDLKKEKKIIKKINQFQRKINKWKIQKKIFLKDLCKKYGPLPAKAFPGRASIIINLLKLNNKYISFIYEKNYSLKINKFVPGTDIRILQEKKFSQYSGNSKILINFAWHISKEIKNYMKKKFNYKGQIIDIISQKDFK